MSDTSDMEDILHEFVTESRDMLDEIEPVLVQLESQKDAAGRVDPETIAGIFRTFHSLKGGAGFLNLNVVVGLAHQAETLLDLIRNDKVVLIPRHTQLFCQCCDALRQMLDGIEENLTDTDHAATGKALEDELVEAIRIAKGQPESTESPSGPEPRTESPAPSPAPAEAEAAPHTPPPAAADDADENVSAKLSRIATLVETVQPDDLSRLAKIHGCCTELVDATSPAGPYPNATLHDKSRALSRVLRDLICGETAQDPDEAFASTMAMIRELPQTGATTPRETADSAPTTQPNVSADLLGQFATEAEDGLKLVEERLMALEKSWDDRDALDDARRGIHNFKGNCGLCGLADLERMSHRIEEILGAFLDGSIFPDEHAIPILLSVVDCLQEAVSALAEGGDGSIDNCDVMLRVMSDLIPHKPEVSCDTAPSPAAAPPIIDLHLESPPTPTVESKAPPPPPKPKPAARPPTAASSIERRQTKRRDIRVDLDKLDTLINLVGELVIAQTLVTHNPDLRGHDFENFDKAAQHLDKISRDLQDISLSVRMIPISGVFRKMIRLVHDLSGKVKKKVELHLIGESTEVDKTVAELLADPLVHIIRNAVDHGVELPAVREENGKPPTGNVYLEAKHEGGEVWVTIRDDGAGLNREKILAKAIANGLVTGDGSNLSDREVFKLVFEPGFSTAETVTDVSGRGVGMDVVKKNLEQLKGRVEVFSKPGMGSTFILHIPLTLAIIDGMLLRVGRARYTVPILSIRETFRPQRGDVTKTMDGQEVVRIRGQLLPVIRIHELYDCQADHLTLEDGLLVVIEAHGEEVCLFVDELIGQQQTVIKGLSGYIGDVPGVSGCAILGTGEVSLILDVGGLLERARDYRNREAALDAAPQGMPDPTNETGESVSESEVQEAPA